MSASCAAAPGASSARASKIKSRFVRRRIAPFRFGQNSDAGLLHHFLQDRYEGSENLCLGGRASPSSWTAGVAMHEFMAANGRPDSGALSMTKTLAMFALALGVAGAPALAYVYDGCM